MSSDMNEQLHRLYRREKIIQWRDTLAGRWNKGECEYREMRQAQGAMEVLAALVTGEAKRQK